MSSQLSAVFFTWEMGVMGVGIFVAVKVAAVQMQLASSNPVASPARAVEAQTLSGEAKDANMALQSKLDMLAPGSSCRQQLGRCMQSGRHRLWDLAVGAVQVRRGSGRQRSNSLICCRLASCLSQLSSAFHPQ